jgi:hypothetical protein
VKNRYGIVVGANDASVEFAEQDARRVFDWLRSHPGWADDNVALLLASQLPKGAKGRDKLRATCTELLVKNPDDEAFVFFYFAGHADLQREELCLSLGSTPVEAAELINSFILASKARCALVVLDCCSSGQVVDAIVRLEPSRWPSIFGQGKRRLDPSHHRAVLAACRADQLAYERAGSQSESESGGLFTRYFMTGCDGAHFLVERGPNHTPSVDQFGVVTFSSLSRYLMQVLDGIQTPRFWLQGGEIAIRSRLEWRVVQRAVDYRVPSPLMFAEPEGQIMVGNTPEWKLPSGSPVHGVRCSDEGTLVLVARRDDSVVALKGRDGNSAAFPPAAPLLSSAPSPQGICLTADGRHVVVRSSKPQSDIQVYELIPPSGRVELDAPITVPGGLGVPYVVLPQTEIIVASDASGRVHCWLLSGRPLARGRELPDSGHKGKLTCMRAFSDGQRFATGGEDGRVCLWKIENAGTASVLSGGHPVPVGANVSRPVQLAASPDGKYLAVGYASGAVQIFDVTEEPTLLHARSDYHMQYVTALDFSPDGQWLASAGADGWVRVIKLKDFSPCQSLRQDAPAMALSFAPIRSRTILAIGNSAGGAQLFQPEQPDRVTTVPGHRQDVFAVRLFGKSPFFLLLAGTQDVEVWRVVSDRDLMPTVRPD